MPADQTDIEKRAQAALAADVPVIYANGFVNSLATGDILVVLERNGKPAAILNLSYTLAKSMAGSLGALIAQLEELAGREMLTTKEIEALISGRRTSGAKSAHK